MLLNLNWKRVNYDKEHKIILLEKYAFRLCIHDLNARSSLVQTDKTGGLLVTSVLPPPKKKDSTYSLKPGFDCVASKKGCFSLHRINWSF